MQKMLALVTAAALIGLPGAMADTDTSAIDIGGQGILYLGADNTLWQEADVGGVSGPGLQRIAIGDIFEPTPGDDGILGTEDDGSVLVHAAHGADSKLL